MLSFAPLSPDIPGATGGALWSAAGSVAWAAVCFCGVLVVFTVLAGVVQVGLHVSPEAAKPQLDRLSPGMGLRRIFSSRGMVRATLAIAKIGAVGFVAWITIEAQLPQIAAACGQGVEEQWSGAWTMLGQMAWRVLLVLAVLGGIDWIWQWRRHRQDLMMTRREVLEDLRKLEGDPLMKARLRRGRKTVAGDES